MTNHATNLRARTLIAGLGLSLAASLAAADFPGFDDVAIGTGYSVADSDTSEGVDYSFGPMPWPLAMFSHFFCVGGGGGMYGSENVSDFRGH